MNFCLHPGEAVCCLFCLSIEKLHYVFDSAVKSFGIVHVDIFDDRMEIMSPGGMPDGSLVQDLDVMNVPSDRRNGILADVFDRLDYMAYPRASALAEVLWTPPGRRRYADFLERLAAHRARFLVQGVNARPRP